MAKKPTLILTLRSKPTLILTPKTYPMQKITPVQGHKVIKIPLNTVAMGSIKRKIG